MNGLLKTRPAINQFLVLFGITLVSLFLVGLAGRMITMAISGVNLADIKDILKTDFNKPGVLTYYRGMQIVQFFALCVIPVFICAKLFSEKPKKYLGLKQPSINTYYLAGAAILILAIPLAGGLGELNKNISLPAGIESWMKEQEATATYLQSGLLSKRSITDLIINLVVIAVTAGVGEELLFRGMAQRLLIKMFKSPWAGIIVSAVLFSAMHMQFYGFFPRLLLGVLLGAAYWYSGSLWVSIVAHFVYDAVVLILVYNRPEMMNETSPVGTGDLLVAGLISAAVVGVILYWMKVKSATRYEEVYGDDNIPVKNHPF